MQVVLCFFQLIKNRLQQMRLFFTDIFDVNKAQNLELGSVVILEKARAFCFLKKMVRFEYRFTIYFYEQ